MSATVGSFLNTQQGVINEIISKSIEFGLPAMSPFWKRVMGGNQTLVERDKMGRDYMIIKTFRQGMAGVLEDGGPRLDSAIFGDPLNTNLGDKTFLQGQGFGANAQGWPDALDGPNPLPYRMKVHMRSMLSNLAWTLSELDAQALPAMVNEIVTPKLIGHATLIDHRMCTQLFLNQNTNYRICACTSVTDLTSGTTTELSFAPDNLSIDRFAIGQRLQFWVKGAAHTTANLKTHDGNLAATVLDRDSMYMVTKIDELKNLVTVKHISGTAFYANATSTGAVFDTTGSDSSTTLEVSFFGSANVSGTPNAGSGSTTGIAGLRSWLKVGDTSGSTQTNDNTLLGLEADGTDKINVNTHPEFKSMEVDMANGVLTEHTLRKILRAYKIRRMKYGHKIDTLLASDGVWLAYEATKIGREWKDRTDRLSSLQDEGSEEGFKFTFDGKTYHGETDSYMDANTVLGIKTEGGNWKRYTRPSGHGKKWDKAPSGLPFELVASSMTGLPSNQLPILRMASNNAQAQLTEYVQMPGRVVMQVVPEQASGLVIKNVAEDRLSYSS
jgi:hypothetical protein